MAKATVSNGPTPEPKTRRSLRGAATSASYTVEASSEEDQPRHESAKRKRGPVRTASPKKKRKAVVSEDEFDTKTGKREYDSDALDDDSDAAPSKRKRKVSSPRKKRTAKVHDSEDETYNLEQGQEVIGKVVQAPTTGRVPPGRISQNTLDFLNHLKDPACNDRQWFRLHEPVYRVAEQEWKDFVESFTDVLVEVDPQVPPLPPKDAIHRIYRDVRFSNDKTPYKRGFSATFSRGGRKGIFAKYHICVKPGNESFVAAGLWCPGKQELANIRTNIQRSSRRFRRVISSPEFVEFFGKAERHPKGERQNIFGHEDELKVAPKGVDKGHKDIDLLKCRTMAVVHKFADSEVLDPDFKNALAKVVGVMKPFVYMLNDLLTVGGGAQSDSDDDDDGGDERGDD